VLSDREIDQLADFLQGKATGYVCLLNNRGIAYSIPIEWKFDGIILTYDDALEFNNITGPPIIGVGYIAEHFGVIKNPNYIHDFPITPNGGNIHVSFHNNFSIPVCKMKDSWE
jgi:hypothetical protein